MNRRCVLRGGEVPRQLACPTGGVTGPLTEKGPSEEEPKAGFLLAKKSSSQEWRF